MDEQSADHRPLALFELRDESGIGLTDSSAGLLDERERRLVIGAANFHALAAPGHLLRIIVLRGPLGTFPALTDRSVHHIEWAGDREAVGSMVLRSVVQPLNAVARPTSIQGLVVDVGGGTKFGTMHRSLPGWQGQVRRTARSLAPIQSDALRQLRTDVVERLQAGRGVKRKASTRIHRATRPGGTGGAPAVLFGLHWLELGGAERWALDTIQMAADADATPIVITDRESNNPWITKPELDSALVVPLTHPMDPATEAAFLNGLLETFDIRGVHVHHNAWLYQRLPWLKAVRPGRFGLPLKEYFIWFDDQEYTLRVTRAAPGVQCLRSVVVHDMGVNRGVNFADVSMENMFKFRYGVRNEASYRLHHQGVGAFVKFAVRLAQQLHVGHVAWPLRIQLLRKLIEGVTFDPKPEYPCSVL